MKRLIILALVSLAFTLGWQSSVAKTPHSPTQPLEFKTSAVGKVVPSTSAYRYRQEHGDIVFVSVREREEWDEEHIPGAIWIPHSKLKEDDKVAWNQLKTLSDTHKYVVIYCGGGHRSGFIAKEAQEKGLKNVYNLDGISFWRLRFPVIKGEAVPKSQQPKVIHLDEAYYYYKNFHDIVFVDVREPESIAHTGGGIIKGAKVIPLSELAKHLDELSCKNEHVFVCEGTYDDGECSASPAAAKIVIKRKGCKAGKQKILFEGYGAWRDAGYPIEQYKQGH